MADYKKGKVVKATVTGIESYGVFVSLDEYYSGLIHISEISHDFVHNIHDFVKIGEEINVEILEVDEELSQLKLRIKNINYRDFKQRPKRKIKETPLGFKTLEYKLPIWIEQKLQKNRQENT